MCGSVEGRCPTAAVSSLSLTSTTSSVPCRSASNQTRSAAGLRCLAGGRGRIVRARSRRLAEPAGASGIEDSHSHFPEGRPLSTARMPETSRHRDDRPGNRTRHRPASTVAAAAPTPEGAGASARAASTCVQSRRSSTLIVKNPSARSSSHASASRSLGAIGIGNGAIATRWPLGDELLISEVLVVTTRPVRVAPLVI